MLVSHVLSSRKLSTPCDLSELAFNWALSDMGPLRNHVVLVVGRALSDTAARVIANVPERVDIVVSELMPVDCWMVLSIDRMGVQVLESPGS
jgi:hypothetical protein